MREDRCGRIYDRDFDATIHGGVGEATVVVPGAVGVRVRAEGLQKDGDAYVNDVHGDPRITVDVEVQGGVGAITLEAV